MNKSNKGLTIFLICLFSLLAVAIVVLLIMLLSKNVKLPNFSFNIPSGNVSDNIVFDKNYEQIPEKIDLNIEIGEVEIINSDEEEISVKIYADEKYIKEYKVETDDGLDIKVKSKDCVGFCINRIIPKIIVTLPSNYDKTITLNNDYGDVNIGKFEKANLIAVLDAGNINVDSIDMATIDNNAGNIKVNKVKDITIKEKAGNVSIKKVNSAAIENDYGNIKIEEINEYMNLSSDCGNINITKANITKDSKIKCDLGNINIKNISNVYIDAKTDLGNIKVNNNDRKSNIKLKIKNDCGDIKVNN